MDFKPDPIDAPPLELWGGMECTINRVGDHFHRQLERRTAEDRLADLERVAALGFRTLRWPLLWEEYAPLPSAQIDWRVADLQMNRLRDLGIRPIVGLVHHGSGPRHTSLIDPDFAELLAQYARAVAERYPWVDAYTPINEPLTTARFSGLYGHWFPHSKDPLTFSRALLNQVRGVGRAMRAVREVNPAAKLVQTEDLGRTFSTPSLRYQAEFENERRWLPFDLLNGKLDPAGSAWRYLRWAGIAEDELIDILADPCPPEVIGVNHYITSSRFLDENTTGYPRDHIGDNGRDTYADVAAVRAPGQGFYEPRELLREAWDRFRIPIAVTEVHLGCTREEQLRWFAEIWHAAKALRTDNVPVLAVTGWALLGAYDWDSLLTRSEGHYEPGAFDQGSPELRPTAIAHLLQGVAASGHCEHPLLGAPGWWRRGVRLLGEHGRRRGLSAIFTPRGGRECPMILIAAAEGGLGEAFARICELRGLPYRLFSGMEMDIADARAVAAALDAFQPWAVINAGNFTDVADAELRAEVSSRPEVTGPETLARLCKANDVAFLTFSSGSVLQGPGAANSPESNSSTRPGGFRIDHADVERRIQAISDRALIVRTGALFGPWLVDDFVARTLSSLQTSEPLETRDGGLMCPTYVPDLVNATLDLLIDRGRGIWHLRNAGLASCSEIVRAVARLANFSDLHANRILPAGIAESNSPSASDGSQQLAPWEDGLRRYFRDHLEVASAPVLPEAALTN